MTTAEVQAVVQNFIDAAHFFFLSRFISPRANHRTDAYGGSTENRAKILLEILRGIKKNSPSLHVSVKINCNDFTRGGLDEAESLGICKMLATAGIDSIEVSGNGTSVAGIRAGVNEGYFAPFAVELAKNVSVPVICVGGWRSLGAMEKILRDTQIEFLSLSRPLVREPDLPNKFQRGDANVSRCISCNACYSPPAHRCIFTKR